MNRNDFVTTFKLKMKDNVNENSMHILALLLSSVIDNPFNGKDTFEVNDKNYQEILGKFAIRLIKAHISNKDSLHSIKAFEEIVNHRDFR